MNMVMMELNNFKFNAFYPNASVLNYSVETGGRQMGIFNWMEAQVPGSVYSDLLRNGVIQDPFCDMNSMDCEWVPERWWVYRTDFHADKKANRHYRLNCQGIDYTASIYLNDIKLGKSENMHVPFKAMIDDILREQNLLEIQIENAPQEHGQIGYTSQTRTQKSRFNYKWDWCVRMIGMGVDRPVYVEEFGASAIEYLNVRQEQLTDGSYRLYADAELFGFEEAEQTVTFTLERDGKTTASVQIKADIVRGENHVTAGLTVHNPELWWPNGHGNQPLYRLCVTASAQDGTVSDTKNYTIGLRQLSYMQADHAEKDAFPYSVKVNGKRIYLKGVNLTPLEMQRGDVTEERINAMMERIRAANINLIRIWGGGYIESDALYEACDRLGIMVWQEFIQSSSGLENVPSKEESFLHQLADTATEAVKRLQTHPALVIYSGGNELSDINGTPSTFEDANIAMLLEIVKKHDDRLMLPTSASGPNEFLRIDQPGKNHDVHGPWKYAGTTEHYHLYNCSDSQLHSEFGVDGMNNMTVFERYISPEHHAVTCMEEDIIWRHHGEWWDTWHRDTEIFGAFAPSDLKAFIACSQYIQGEGLRYALEANRRRAFENCGSIIWQYNEPYPNVAGTNLEDYFGEAKLAYWFVQDAFRLREPSLRYDKLIWEPHEEVKASAYISNDLVAFDAALTIRVTDWEGNLLYQTDVASAVPANSSCKLCDMAFQMPQQGAAVIELALSDQTDRYLSRYLLFVKNKDGFIDREIVIAEYDQMQFQRK